MSLTTTKSELREQARARRAALSAEEVAAKSGVIRRQLAGVARFAAARTVLAYVSHRNEVDTHRLIAELLDRGCRVGVPWYDSSRQEYGASWVERFPGELRAGKLGILEPRPESVRPARIDEFEVFLVPGLAFDERGGRLGHGRGYYDRLLAVARGVKIALAYDFQVIPMVPVRDHDVAMDCLVTETRIIECLRSTS